MYFGELTSQNLSIILSRAGRNVILFVFVCFFLYKYLLTVNQEGINLRVTLFSLAVLGLCEVCGLPAAVASLGAERRL